VYAYRDCINMGLRKNSIEFTIEPMRANGAVSFDIIIKFYYSNPELVLNDETNVLCYQIFI